MRGPPPKAPEDRQRRNQPEPLAPVDPDRALAPPPDFPELEAFTEATQDAWYRLWGSPLAKFIEETTDLPALRRLFTLYDARDRAMLDYTASPTVSGSQGQDVLNPAWRVVQSCDAEIRALEDRFGLTPVARYRLGIKIGEAHKSLGGGTPPVDPHSDDPRDE